MIGSPIRYRGTESDEGGDMDQSYRMRTLGPRSDPTIVEAKKWEGARGGKASEKVPWRTSGKI